MPIIISKHASQANCLCFTKNVAPKVKELTELL